VTVNVEPQAMFLTETTCEKDTTHFTDQSLAPGSQVTGWLWDFGDGTPGSTLQNPVHLYQESGTYQVTLTVTNLGGCSNAITLPVEIRPAPVAAFTYTSFFCPAGQVQFQDQSMGQGSSITERLWIFEPGFSSDLPNPVYTFGVTDTVYAVTLMVTDNFGCRDTIIDSIYVNPAFAFTFTFDTVCHNSPTHFMAQNLAEGDSLYSLTWEFSDPASGENNISHDYNPVHTFTQPGTYPVKLKARDRDNCVDSVYRDVIVRGMPVPQFTSTVGLCDSVVTFTDQSASGGGSIESWVWDFGDGTAPVVIPAPGPGNTSHEYAQPGDYAVTLTVTNSSGCSATFSDHVQPSSCLTAAFIQAAPQTCAGSLATFYDQSQPSTLIGSWHWIWGDGTDTTYNSSAPEVQHRYAAPGVYPVMLVVSTTFNQTTFTDTAMIQVMIMTSPKALFTSNVACLNQLSLFQDNTMTYGEPLVSWSWNFGEPGSGTSDSSSLKDPSHQYQTAGQYEVKLVVTNQAGCTDSLTKPVRIYGNPQADFITSPVCAGNPTNFYDRSLAADTLTSAWKWNFGDPAGVGNTSLEKDPVHRYYDAGDYRVSLQVKDENGCSDTVDSTIRVNPSPVSLFHLTENYDGMPGKILLNNESQGADYFFWDFGNGHTSEEENPVVTYTEDGNYLITLITGNTFDCMDTTFYQFEQRFKGLFVPNAFAPLSTNLGVALFKPVGMNLKKYHVQVFNTWNQLLWESTALDDEGRPKDGWDGKYDNNLCPSGTYLWKIDAVFIDGTIWEGSSVGSGQSGTAGLVTLIR